MKMFKRISVMLAVIMMVGVVSPMVSAAAAEVPEKAYEDYTMEEIKAIVADYNEKYQWFSAFNSDEFSEFALDRLMNTSKEDELPEESLIGAYLSYYLYCEQNQLGDNNQDSVVEDDEFLATTIQDIRDEMAANDRMVAQARANSVVPFAAYNASAAVAYAKRHGNYYNENYYAYSSDCTNFVSQCVYAGGMNMDQKIGTSTIGSIVDSSTSWYYYATSIWDNPHVTTSWIRVSDFNTYWRSKLANVYSTTVIRTAVSLAAPGDVVQLAYQSTGVPYHSIIISGKTASDLTFCGHTTNRTDAPFIQNMPTSNAQFLIFKFSTM